MYIGNVHTLPIEVEIPVHSCFIKKEKGYKRGKRDHYASIIFDFVETRDIISFI